ATNNMRVAARDWMMPIVRERLARYSAAEVSAVFEREGLPFAPIVRPDELLEITHLNETCGLDSIMLTDGRATKAPLLPISLDGDRPGVRMNPPQLGSHSRELLVELGYDDPSIDQLFARKVVASHARVDAECTNA